MYHFYQQKIKTAKYILDKKACVGILAANISAADISAVNISATDISITTIYKFNFYQQKSDN